MNYIKTIVLVLCILLLGTVPAFASEPVRIERFGLIGDFTRTQGETYDVQTLVPHVNVYLENGERLRMAVHWVARERAELNATGYTEYDGFVSLPENGSITNEENKSAYMRVYITKGDALRVRRIEVVPDLEVAFGTPENLIPFPSEVRVDLSNNTQRTLPIRFKANEPYRPLQEGAYQFIGMIDLPDDGSLRLEERNSITLRVSVAPEQSEVLVPAGETKEALNPGIPPTPNKVPLIYFMLPLGILTLLGGAFYLSTRIKK